MAGHQCLFSQVLPDRYAENREPRSSAMIGLDQGGDGKILSIDGYLAG